MMKKKLLRQSPLWLCYFPWAALPLSLPKATVTWPGKQEAKPGLQHTFRRRDWPPMRKHRHIWRPKASAIRQFRGSNRFLQLRGRQRKRPGLRRCGCGGYDRLPLYGRSSAQPKPQHHMQAEAIESEEEREAFLNEQGSADAAATFSYITGRQRGTSFRTDDADSTANVDMSAYRYVTGQQRGSSY